MRVSQHGYAQRKKKAESEYTLVHGSVSIDTERMQSDEVFAAGDQGLPHIISSTAILCNMHSTSGGITPI
ncbi:hypothetical protein VMCG_02852 [Cytospora schulzeri]|uniref:Uncharacterized protein n=1 Tax=Cytospora schulzeri TaxID=448051 RepID=A0A423WZP8_9PEZI|nr:hypothetical protein VMCG_02852 [Valsa malicola]